MKRNAGKPVDPRIIEVLYLAEADGESTATQIRPRLSKQPVEPSTMSKLLSRAVGLGLMEADRFKAPIKYKVVSGWRDAVGIDENAVAYAPELPSAKLLADAMAMRPDVRTTWRGPAPQWGAA